MAVAINRLTNANIYLDNGSLLGKVEEIKLPDIAVKMSEHKALGMVGTIELPNGFEKLEGEIKWSSYYKDVMTKIANPFTFLPLQVRGSLETYTSQGRIAEVPVVIFLTVAFKKVPGGNFKQNDPAEFPTSYTCYYMKQMVDGEDVLELDVMANIYKVGGVDALGNYRANIG